MAILVDNVEENIVSCHFFINPIDVKRIWHIDRLPPIVRYGLLLRSCTRRVVGI